METALYLPVKRFLEKLGFTVKGEVGGCDLVALSGDDPPVVVIGELKLSFNLELVLQAVDRAGACDEVWLAAKTVGARQGPRERRALSQSLPPARLRHARRHQHRRCRGDRQAARQRPRAAIQRSARGWSPSTSGARAIRRMGGSTRAPIMTAYRQQALACASALSGGPRRVKDLRAEIPDAGKILLHNVYGWFDRAERGIYVLTDAGHAALKRWPQQPLDLSAHARHNDGR